MSLLSIVASSSAFRLPASPPPKASSIDSDWSTKNKKQPGFLRLISAWYAMVSSYKTQIDVFASRPTTLTYQRSQVRLVSRPSPECSRVCQAPMVGVSLARELGPVARVSGGQLTRCTLAAAGNLGLRLADECEA